jgi:integrase
MAKARQNGEGSVYQRASDGLWIGSVTLSWEGGKRKRKTVSAKTAQEARAKLREVQKNVDAGLPVGDGKITVDQLLDRWFNTVLRHQVASVALSNYEGIASCHIRPTLGSKQIAKLSPVEIDALLSKKLDSGLSVSTVRRIRSVLAQALTQAQRWELVGRNAAALSRPPKASRREGRSLTPDEARKLMAALRGHRLEACFLLMLGTGLRRGEALGLRWDDIDLDRAVVTVRNQLRREVGRTNSETGEREGAGLVLIEPKTEKSRREVDLPGFVVAALKTHKARQAAERLNVGPAWRDSEFVFTSSIGTPLDPRNVTREFGTTAKRAGLQRADEGAWHIHELRHTAASMMLDQNLAIEVVSAVLGHSSIRMTADVYGHIARSSRQASASAMDAALASS